MTRQLGKRQLERAQQTFEAAVTAELEAHRAVFDGHFHHMMPTRAGLLLARGISCVSDAGGFVALRFDDVDAAKAFLRARGTYGESLNPYSGKWNLNLYGREFGEGCQDRIRAALRLKLSTVTFGDEVSADEWKRRLDAGIEQRRVKIARMFGTEGTTP